MAKTDRIGEGIRAFSKHSHRTAAIIVAAGSGSRMRQGEQTLIERFRAIGGGREPATGGPDLPTKQFIELCGKPMVAYSLIAFEQSEYIDEIVVVARQGEQDRYPALFEQYGIGKGKAVVIGGESRQESVWKGFSAISDDCDFVAIHDAARPLVTPEIIRKVILAGFDGRAASAAVPAKDTVKQTNVSAFVEQTFDREKIWLVQTPQVFYANLYRAAAVVAQKDSFKATDDCSLAEHAGFSVKLVNTGSVNLKVTTPEDLIFARAILDCRAGSEGI